MAADAEKRSKFIKSVLDFLIKYNFDGLDFDWEYPANRGGATSDKVQHIRHANQIFNIDFSIKQSKPSSV